MNFNQHFGSNNLMLQASSRNEVASCKYMSLCHSESRCVHLSVRPWKTINIPHHLSDFWSFVLTQNISSGKVHWFGIIRNNLGTKKIAWWFTDYKRHIDSLSPWEMYLWSDNYLPVPKFPYEQFPATNNKGADNFPLVRQAIKHLAWL